MSDPSTIGTGLALGRAAVGVASWLLPSLSMRILGVDPATHPAMPPILRLFGARDAAMGLAYLTAGEQERKRWLAIGMAVDAADAAAALLSGRRGGLPLRTRLGVALTATAAVVGAGLARRD